MVESENINELWRRCEGAALARRVLRPNGAVPNCGAALAN